MDRPKFGKEIANEIAQEAFVRYHKQGLDERSLEGEFYRDNFEKFKQDGTL